MASLDGPNISVRLNRSVVLRHQCIRRVSSILCRPPMSEISQIVISQNKAEEVVLDKRVQAWHKDKSMALEKLNRYQNITYEAFLRIEMEKKALLRYSDGFVNSESAAQAKITANDRGPSTVGLCKNESVTGHRVKSSNTFDNDADELLKMKPKRIHAISAHGQSEGSFNCPTPGDGIRGGKRRSPPPLMGKSNTSLDLEFPEISTKRAQSHTGVSSRESVMKLPLSTAVDKPISNSGRPSRKKIKIAKLPPTAAKSTKLFRGNTTEISNPRIDEIPEHTASEQVVMKRTSWPNIGNQSQSDGTFSTYRKDGSGRIVISEVPYRRRMFPKPKENNTFMQDWLLEQEAAKKLQQQLRYEDLNKKLIQLDEWNPLELLRSLKPQVYRKARLSTHLQRLGSLDILNKAYQNAAEQELLKALDPNSPEALRMCKYLRKKRPTVCN